MGLEVLRSDMAIRQGARLEKTVFHRNHAAVALRLFSPEQGF